MTSPKFYAATAHASFVGMSLALLTASSWASTAQSGETTAWVVDIEGGELYRSTKDALAANLELVAPLPAGAMAADLDAEGGELWVILASGGGAPEAGTVDLMTGEYAQRGRDLPFSSVDALTVTPSGNRWYAVENSGPDALIWCGSLLHARMELVATLSGASPVSALAVNLDGDLFAFDDGRNEILAVDPVAGTSTVVSTTSIAGSFLDWDFDWATGELVGAFERSASLVEFVRIDPLTGEVAPLEDLGGLGFSPGVSVQRSGRGMEFFSICGPATPNASGSAATLRPRGSSQRVLGDVTLVAESMPTGSFGLILASLDPGSAVTPSGATGNLCLGGAIGRIAAPGGLFSTGLEGTFSVSLDLDAIPQPMGAIAVEDWSAWNFQAWFRDSDQGMATSNFSDAIRVPLRTETDLAPYRPRLNRPSFFSIREFADLTGNGQPELIQVETPGLGPGLGTLTVFGLDDEGLYTQVIDTEQSNWRPELEVGDLDGDGDLDLAMATYTQRLAVLLNDGSGQLTPGVRIQVCQIDMSRLRIADFNGDGMADVSCACMTGNRTELLFGTGEGSLATPLTLVAGGSPYAGLVFGVGDVDGDGIVDLVATNASLTQSMQGLGGGLFGAPANVAADSSSGTAVTADVTGDGRIDLITSPPGAQIIVQAGLAQGGFGSPVITQLDSSQPVGAVHDVDGDGLADVVVSEFETDLTVGATLYLMRSLGDGQFERSILSVDHSNEFSPQPRLAMGGSFADGNLVLARSILSFRYEIVSLGAGASTYRTGVTTSLANGTGVSEERRRMALGDIDLDGIPDALISITLGGNSSELWLLPGMGDGRFRMGSMVDVVDGRQIEILDIDGDGDLDASVTNDAPGASNVKIYANEGGQLALAATIAMPDFRSQQHTFGDIDRDGRLDVIMRVFNGQGSAGVAVSLQDAQGGFGVPVFSLNAPVSQTIEAADMDADGYVDIVALAGSEGVLVYYGTADGGFEPGVPVAGIASLFAVEDLSGDGVPDIVLTGGLPMDQSVIRVLTSLPGRRYVQFRADATGQASNFREVEFADLNGDGMQDLVLGTNMRAIVIFYNLGHGQIGNLSALLGLPDDIGQGNAGHGSDIELNDLDSDGAIDLVRYVPFRDRIETRFHRRL